MSQEKKIVKKYIYQNESGEPILEVVRFEPKDFRQYSIMPDGTKASGIDESVPLCLYKLPWLKDATEVFIVEGEKDAETLAEIGLTATTAAGGANAVWQQSYTETLAGKTVFIIPDQDAPGLARAQEVLGHLQDVCTCYIVQLPEGKDVTDYLVKLRHHPKDLNALIEISKLPENAPARKLISLVRNEVSMYAVESEKVVIGAILKGLVQLSEVSQIETKILSCEAHRYLWQSICRVSEKAQPDRSAVTQDLEDNGRLVEVGGISYLLDLTEDLAPSFDINHHAENITSKAANRQLVKDLTKGVQDLIGGDDSEDIRSRLEGVIKNVTANVGQDTFSVTEICGNLADFLAPKEPGIMCAPIDPVMRAIRGFRPGQLAIVGGRPGGGKSSLLAEMCVYAASKGHNTDVLSFEVTKEEYLLKTACMVAKVALTAVLDGSMTPAQTDRLAKRLEWLKTLPLRVDDRSDWTISKIKNMFRRRKQQGSPIRVLGIDYLQLFEVPGGSSAKRYEAIGNLTRNLKKLAIEYKATIIVLSQLGREGEKEGRMPKLTDLRESGNIEQDADVVLLIHQEGEDDHEQPERDAWIIVAKQRNGPQPSIRVKFAKPFTYFYAPGSIKDLDYRALAA